MSVPIGWAQSPALTVSGMTKTYGRAKVLDDVSLRVHHGEVVCLVGPNGSGKTTLVECIEGVRVPDSGRVEICGQSYGPTQRRPASLGVQLQEESLPARIRVGEAVDLFADLYRTHGLPDRVVELLDLAPLWQKPFDALSGGQKRRTVVGLALVGDPEVVILDEPASGLDPDGQQGIERLVMDLRAAGKAVCLTVHDLTQAEQIANRVVLLSRGHVLKEGPPVDVLRDMVREPFCMEVRGQAVDIAPPGLRVVRHDSRTYLYGTRDVLENAVTPSWPCPDGWTLRPVQLLDAYLAAAQLDADSPAVTTGG